MPHTAGKTQRPVAMYFGQPVANLCAGGGGGGGGGEFLPDEAIPPTGIKMGDGEAPVVEEFKTSSTSVQC